VVITKEERYFGGHEEADRAFGFGFRWRAGSK
jgi:tellurite resistance protein TerA